MKRFIITICLIMLAGYLFAGLFDTSGDDPVDVSAGIATYKWEIEKLLMESYNRVVPKIVQGGNDLTADTIIYDYESETGYAYGNLVYYNAADNTTLTANSGTYYTQEEKIVCTGNPQINMRDSGVVANSDTMIFYSDSDYVIMIGDVVIKGDDYELEGDRATYFQSSGRFKLTGDAGTIQDDKNLTADKIEISSDNNKLENYTATGNVIIENQEEGYIIRGGRMDYYKNLGYTRVTEEPEIEFIDKDIFAYCNVLEQYEEENKANLMGNVIIVQGEQKAYARWGEYLGDEKLMYLTGNPIMANGDSMFNTQKIIMDVETEEMSMVGGGTGFFNYE